MNTKSQRRLEHAQTLLRSYTQQLVWARKRLSEAEESGDKHAINSAKHRVEQLEANVARSKERVAERKERVEQFHSKSGKDAIKVVSDELELNVNVEDIEFAPQPKAESSTKSAKQTPAESGQDKAVQPKAESKGEEKQAQPEAEKKSKRKRNNKANQPCKVNIKSLKTRERMEQVLAELVKLEQDIAIADVNSVGVKDAHKSIANSAKAVSRALEAIEAATKCENVIA